RALPATPAMRKRLLTGLLLLATSAAWADETALRLKDLQRCGNLFAAGELTYCLRGEGLGEGDLRVMLHGKPVAVQREERNRLRLTLNEKNHRSGPLWLEQDGRSEERRGGKECRPRRATWR